MRARGLGRDAGNKAAILARIAKAKQYKQQGGGEATGAGTPTPAATAPPSDPVVGPRPAVDWGAVASFLDSGGKDAGSGDSNAGPLTAAAPAMSEQQAAAAREAAARRSARFEASKDRASEEYSPMDTDNSAYVAMMMAAAQAPQRGSANSAAGPLQAILTSDGPGNQLTEGLDMGSMRQEEITAAKEARLRQLGAEILTVDPNYRAGGGGAADSGGEIVSTVRNADAAALLLGRTPAASDPPTPTAEDGDDMRVPAVSTWGVFPQPKDVSKKYGGGRNLKPGQALETAEQKRAREAAYAEAMRAYRAKTGLEVDAGDEARAQELYDAGMALFAKSDLTGAYEQFDKAMAAVPLKTRVGGLAALQAAIILDSRGEAEAAQRLYRKLRGHAVATVSRKSKQMLFGFKAATYLKADQFSYAARKGDFDRYFRQLADRNQIWVPTEEEKEEAEQAARAAALIAVVVILGPLALMGTLVVQSAGRAKAVTAAATALATMWAVASGAGL